MATCVALGKAKYPTTRDGEKIKPMEGINSLPAFNGKPLTRRQPLFWEHEGNRAVREGKWKLVAKENQPWELYDMEKDRSEVNDLATSYPKKVKELAAKWDAFAKRADVLPLGTWHAKAQPIFLATEMRKCPDAPGARPKSFLLFVAPCSTDEHRNFLPKVVGRKFIILKCLDIGLFGAHDELFPMWHGGSGRAADAFARLCGSRSGGTDIPAINDNRYRLI